MDFWVTASVLGWVLASAYSFAPFDLVLPSFRLADELPLAEHADPRYVRSVGFHLLAFGTLGAIDRLSAPGNDTRIIARVLLRGALLCVLIEFGQTLFPSRHERAMDLAVNVLGLSIGHWIVGAGLHAANSTRRLPPEGLRSRGAAIGAFVVWGLFWSSALLAPARFVSLADWDLTYPLLIGNEREGERPWDGQIEYVAIYDRPLSPEEVRLNLARRPAASDGPAPAHDLRPLVAYTFSDEDRFDVVPSGTLGDPGLHLRIPATARWAGDGMPALVLTGDSVVSSAGAAEALSRRIAATGAFSVEVWLRPASLCQTGPARIVGISHNPWRRNFTLGQEGRAVYFRVRNGFNGLNGDLFELRSEDTLSDAAAQIVATYDRGVSRVFRNGQQLSRAMDLREPSVLLSLGATRASRFATAVLAALSLILASAWYGGRAGLIQLIGVAYTTFLGALALAAWFGIWPAMTLVVLLAPAFVLVWVALHVPRVAGPGSAMLPRTDRAHGLRPDVR